MPLAIYEPNGGLVSSNQQSKTFNLLSYMMRKLGICTTAPLSTNKSMNPLTVFASVFFFSACIHALYVQYIPCCYIILCCTLCTVCGNCVCVLLWENGRWPCLVSWCMASCPALHDSALLAFSRDLTSSRKTFSTRSSYEHKQAIINQMGISRGEKLSSLQYLLELSLLGSVTWFIHSFEYCNRNLQCFHSSTDVKRTASKAQRGMTKTMECGSFNRRSLFAEAALFSVESGDHVSLWLVKYFTEITAD